MASIVNWFEIPVTDFDRAKKFYSALFSFEMAEQQMGPYRMGFLPGNSMEGDVTGAISQGEGCVPGADGVTLYLNGGEDLSAHLARVEPAGGKVIMHKTEITPEIGYMAMFLDTEGNRLAFHSPR